ncbi:helix-turn-helix domain-containing protein [Serinibacter salmoneus]|nr:helix-turn-helix domain-containing protein [Serinibacter salmoneus]
MADAAPMPSRLLNARSLTRLGRAVGGLRRERGWTQAALAERAGVSRQWLNGLENGRIEGLEVGRLLRVLDTLGASLMIRDDARTSEEPE